MSVESTCGRTPGLALYKWLVPGTSVVVQLVVWQLLRGRMGEWKMALDRQGGMTVSSAVCMNYGRVIVSSRLVRGFTHEESLTHQDRLPFIPSSLVCD